MRPELSVLIVSWNVPDVLAACLRSIQRTAGELAHEVILVDNASTDDIVGMVERDFAWVRLIRNRENVGFPRANNQALAAARGRYVLFLNPDTEVGPGTLSGCVRELEQNPDVGLVGSRLVLPDGSIQLEGGRRTYHLRHLLSESVYLHMLFPKSRWFADYRMGWWDHTDVRDVEGLAGAFMMAPRDLAVSLGGLPEDLFMYHEDASFCLRVLRAGRRIRYRGDLITLHHSQQSSQRSPLRLDLLKTECRLMLLREADGRAAAAAGRTVWAVASILRLLVSLLGPVLPRLSRRYPRVFDTVTHARQFVWCVAPWLLSRWLPRAPAEPRITFSAEPAT
jgi:GT2 family glycosyltransferase